MHDARYGVLAVVKAARVSVLANLPKRRGLRRPAGGRRARGVYRIAGAGAAIVGTAPRLFARAGCERDGSATAPRPFQSRARLPLSRLGTATLCRGRKEQGAENRDESFTQAIVHA